MGERRLISLVLPVFLLVLILFTGSTSGINVSIINLVGSYLKGTTINFQATVEIDSPEHLPVNYANITFTFPDSTTQVCQVYLNQSVYGCNFLTVNSIDFDSLTYGYGYGYGYDNGYGYSLGYGYGYSGQGSITFNFTLSTSSLPAGSYNAKIGIYSGIEPNTHTFESSTVSFTITHLTTFTTTTIPSRSGGGITPSYLISIEETETNIVQREETQYQVRVRNGGNVYLERVYLLLSLPEDAYSTSDPISLEVGEEGILNYSVNLPPGNYPFTLTVVGEIGERRVEDNREVLLTIPSEVEEETTTIPVPETSETPSPSPSGITGLVTGVREFATNYWFGIPIVILLGLWLFYFKFAGFSIFKRKIK